MGKKLDLTGQVFERLTVIKEAGKDKHGNYIWECQCKCGTKTKVLGQNLRKGSTRSCGCLAKEWGKKAIHNAIKSVTKHKMSHTKEYQAWVDLNYRCFNPANTRYPQYGKKGITVCPEWVNSFEQFYKDMGPCPVGKRVSIDRIEPNGNYEPSNCRWVINQSIQAINQRKKSNNTSGVTGVYQPKGQTTWCANIGVNNKRLHLGTFKTKAEAIKARKTAEEKYHKPILDSE